MAKRKPKPVPPKETSETITKQQLLAWVANLKADSVTLTHCDFLGGGVSSPGRNVSGYTLTLDVCEECANDEQPGMDYVLAPNKKIPLVIPIILEEANIHQQIECGFYQEWVSGKYGGVDFRLDAGMGMGTDWLQFRYGDRAWRYPMATFVRTALELLDLNTEEVGT